ncbi:Plasmodium vivax Vir protein, putative [Plasmodium vivax]|nr:Plasmodium vivax Vir protein, putative [Plasmodium vivax]
MASNQEDLWYVEYDNYNYVKSQYNNAIKYKDYDKDDLDKIMQAIQHLNPKLSKNDDFIINFYKLLSNGQILYSGLNINYCKYINFWLNKEYRDKNYYSKVSDFNNIFKTFVKQLNHVMFGNQHNSCEKYINYLDPEIYKNVNLLHLFYDAYNKIKTKQVTNLNDKCDLLRLLAKNYSESIDKYYDDKIFYDKLENVKNLILKEIENLNYPCANKLYFKKPTKVVELEAAQARKEAEEEADRQAREAAKQADEEAKRRQIENEREQQNLSQSKDSLSGLPANELEEMRHDNEDFHSNSYRAGSPELETTGLQSYTQRYVYPERQESLLVNGYTTREQMPNAMEGREQQSGLDEEQGDKGPVLGVSGGMGALFLLFKYTPVGSFFGGRRRRFRQIPSSFGGFPPGEFPNFHDYEGGYIGYGPTSISSLAE